MIENEKRLLIGETMGLMLFSCTWQWRAQSIRSNRNECIIHLFFVHLSIINNRIIINDRTHEHSINIFVEIKQFNFFSFARSLSLCFCGNYYLLYFIIFRIYLRLMASVVICMCLIPFVLFVFISVKCAQRVVSNCVYFFAVLLKYLLTDKKAVHLSRSNSHSRNLRINLTERPSDGEWGNGNGNGNTVIVI